MKKRIFFVVLSLFFFGAIRVCSETVEGGIEVLEPEKKEFVDNAKSSIRVAASKRKSSVFINGEYFGTTPLTIEDLTPATYILKVEKGEKARAVLVEVKRGMKLDFFVEL